MDLSAEKEIVNYWYNKKGFFTINNIKTNSNRDIGILALRINKNEIEELSNFISAEKARTLESSPKNSFISYIEKSDRISPEALQELVNQYRGLFPQGAPLDSASLRRLIREGPLLPQRQPDDITGLMDDYFAFVASNAGIRKAIAAAAGEQEIATRWTQARNQIGQAYVRQRTRFLAEFDQTFSFVEYLSTHKLVGLSIGQDGKVEFQTARIEGPILPGDTEAYTVFSMAPDEVAERRGRFERGMRYDGLEDVTSDLFKISTMLADPRARAEISQRLGEIELQRSGLLKERLASGEFKVDVLTVGASVHASSLVTTLKALRPDLSVGAVDQYSQAGYAWTSRGWIQQNNTQGPASVEGGNLPREGGDLFPVGTFGAVRVPMISSGRWPNGEDAGTAIRWNLNQHLDHLLLNHKIVGVERALPLKGNYKVTLESTIDGSQGIMYADTIVTTGQYRARNPFESQGTITDTESHTIYHEEIAKARNGQPSLIHDYETLSITVSKPLGIRQLLQDRQDGTPQTIGVAGDGDGGNTIVGLLLEQQPGKNVYRGRTVQENGARPNIVWFGQKATTARQYSEQSRGLYAQVCAGFTSGKIKSNSSRVGKIRRSGSGLMIYPLEESGAVSENGYYADKLIASVGYDPIPDSEIFKLGTLERTPVFDREGRGVASRLDGTQIYFIGPSSGIGPEQMGSDVSDVFKKLAVGQNNVANWWRGYQAQRAGVQLARELRPSGSF